MKERLKLIKQIIKEELNKEVFVYDDVMRSVFEDNPKKLIKYLNKQNYKRIEIPSSLSIFDNELTKLPDNLIIQGSLILIAKNLTELPKNLTITRGNIDARSTSILELPEDTKISGGRFYPSVELSSKKRKENNEWDISKVGKESIGERANALHKFIIETFDESDFENINDFEVYDIIPEIIKHHSMYRFEIPKLNDSVWVVGTYNETEATAIDYHSDIISDNKDHLDLNAIEPFLNKRRMLDAAYEYITDSINDSINDNPEGWGLDPDDVDENGEYSEDTISERIDFFYEEAKEDVVKFFKEQGMEEVIPEYLNTDSYAEFIVENDGFDIIEQYYDSIGEERVNLNDYYIARID